MVLRKTSDQYLATCKVSTQSINMVKRYRLTKTLTKNLNIKISKSVTLTSRSPINMVKRYRLLKNFNQKLKHKISKSVTLTSRSPRVGHDGTA